MKRRRYVLALSVVAVLFVAATFLIRGRSNPKHPSVAANIPTFETRAPEAQPGFAENAAAGNLTNALFQTPHLLWQRPIPEETFARFHDWAERFLAARNTDRAALEAEGVELAIARRKELASLIKSDPERALELTVPLSVRRKLPASVESMLEERVSGRGDLSVLGVLPEPGKEAEVRSTIRTVTLGEREFDAYVYGWRLGEATRTKIPLNGIALDTLMAVSANSLRILEPEEAAEAKAKLGEATCSVSGQSSTIIGEEVAADIGGEITFFCRRAHAEKTNEKNIAAEGGGPGTAADGETPEASAWTEGLKKVILIRVDFPDLTNVPLSDASAISLIANLHNFFNEMSYGRAGFYTNGAGSDFTPTFRMSQPAAYYGTNDYYNQLRTEARNAATAAGYILSNYDRDVICMGGVPGFGWAGLAYVGSAGAWLRNSFGTGVAAHELGHNWGLNHANYWDTAGTSVIGPGTSTEYGDSFDTMGSASAGNNHFNARYKNHLNWLTTNEVVTATTNGTYRIYAHDNPNSTGIRGLRVVKNSSTNYWVEFRQKFTSNKWMMNGAGLRRAQNGNQKSELLDTTPGSTDGKNDSAVVIGRTFSDAASGIHITPIRKGGTSPESLDVVVNVGTFPGNLPPIVDFAASATNAATGVAITFNATASDPYGDDLAYYWDFGDGNFGTNGPIAAKSWSTAGEYLVRCVVSDMKGGVGSQSLIVTIGSPTTYRISGQVTTTNGSLQGVRVWVSSTRMSYTDSDGSYDIVGLPAGSYTVAANLENYTFTTNFSNPVSVGPNKTGMDFVANQSTLTAPAITTQPLGQTVNPGATATFTVVATGTSPLRYQWRFNGANISGATNSSYTRSNIQATNAGNYSVVVSNLAGTATSANAALTVNTPPVITAQPQSQTIIAGNAVQMNVIATGTSPLAYQWRLDGTNLPGATASVLTVANAQPSNAGNYTVIISNSLGSATSTVATLTVNYSLTVSATGGGSVTKSPSQASYSPGASVIITASQGSGFPFSGWSGNASGSNNPLPLTLTTNLNIVANFDSPVPDLTVDNPQATFTGTWSTGSLAEQYSSDHRTTGNVAGNPTATAKFTPTILIGGRYDVYVWFPTVTRGAANTPFMISSAEGTFNFVVDQSAGTGGWQLLASGRLFAAGTNGFVQLANNVGSGNKIVVADAVRWAYSSTQDAPPQLVTAPQSGRVIEGQPITFSALASGSDPLSYQWRFNASPIPGATSPALTLNNAQAANAGNYDIVFSNPVGAGTSSPANLVVSVHPWFGPLAFQSNGQPKLTLSGTPGDRYTLESSSNLSSWAQMTTLSNQTGTVQFTDPAVNNGPVRFYRARLLP